MALFSKQHYGLLHGAMEFILSHNGSIEHEAFWNWFSCRIRTDSNCHRFCCHLQIWSFKRAYFSNVLIILSPSNYPFHLLPLIFTHHITSPSFWQPYDSNMTAGLPRVPIFLVYWGFYLSLGFWRTNKRADCGEVWEALFLCVPPLWSLATWWLQVW